MTAEVWIRIGASTLLGFLVFVIAKLWVPIAESIEYRLGVVRQRVQDLEDAVKRLGEMDMDLRRLDPVPWSQRYKGWVRRVRDLRAKADEIKAAGHNHNHSGCGLSEQATKELKKAADLIETGEELLKEAQARPRRARVPAVPVLRLPRNQLWGMESYKQKVLDFIQNNSTHKSGLLGIWGMGGVGKTSLLELVRDSLSADVQTPILFDHVLFVRAGRGATVATMQKAIAASLGLLHLMPDDETSQETITPNYPRGRTIHNHLQDKSFLLLIDDLWGYHDLQHVGIPIGCQSQRKVVVFTTRSYSVCITMVECTENIIQLGCLREADAWELFIDKVGNEEITTGDHGLHARKLVRECGGLPLALCTIARAMSTKKDVKEWIGAIDLLEKLKFREIINGKLDNLENDLKELRDLVGTSDDVLKAVLALAVMLTPTSRNPIISYIQLKEIIADRPSLHGMGSYKMKVLGFVENKTFSCLLGIWGVPGVGKTTLLRFVRDYAHDLFPYDAFFVGAGPGCTILRLQHALCVNIGLDPPPFHHMTTDQQVSLAKHISISLEGTPFLLLVDDVLERLDLAALGLPMPLRHYQKVIFTTRNQAVCTEMGCTQDTSIHMECLGEQDAWNLFNDRVGDEIINDHPRIRHLAEQMVAECLGLPSVLCTLGRVMSTKRDVKEWRYAYDELFRMKPPPQGDGLRKMDDDERYSHLYDLKDTLLKHSFF